ncbi:hypothetical protein [Polymorphospora sp. NPDC050346]|uniref:hypothetical protein n=1 Tax=Polymorphospora sp. NPDC050346 TaxID=3155780 RepID=UPI0033DCCD7D
MATARAGQRIAADNRAALAVAERVWPPTGAYASDTVIVAAPAILTALAIAPVPAALAAAGVIVWHAVPHPVAATITAALAAVTLLCLFLARYGYKTCRRMVEPPADVVDHRVASGSPFEAWLFEAAADQPTGALLVNAMQRHAARHRIALAQPHDTGESER